MDKHGQNLEIPRPCIPTTSLRPILPEPPMILPGMQGNQPNQAYWLRSGKFSSNSTQQKQTENVVLCTDSTSEASNRECTGGFGSWEATLAGKLGVTDYNVKTYRDLIMDAAASVENVSLQDLIALANAAPATSMTSRGNDSREKSSAISPPNFDSASILVTKDSSLGSNTWVHGKQTPDDPISHWWHSYDLNMPFGTAEESASLKTNSGFAPITPDKMLTAKSKQISELQDLWQGGRTNHDREVQKKDANGKEILNSATDASNAAIFTPFKEDWNCDNGGSYPIELNETPQQKPRRKKHRPKVITEGKAKKTPKSITPEPAGSRVKRKYVRKKGLGKPQTTSPPEAAEESDLKQLDCMKKSSRRRLNFDMEEGTREESSTCKPTSYIDPKSRTKKSCTRGIQSKSTVQFGVGIEMTIDNRQMGIACDLHSSANNLLKDFMSWSEKAPRTPLPTKPRPKRGGRRRKGDSAKENTEDKQIANGQHNEVQLWLPCDPQSPTKDLNCSTRRILNEERQAQGSKRKCNDAIEQAETGSSNVTGYHYNALHVYQHRMITWAHFPIISKKRRSEKGQNSSSSSTSSSVTTAKDDAIQGRCLQNDAKADPSVSKTNCWVLPPQCGAFTVPATFREVGRGSLQDKLQSLEAIAALSHTEKLTKKRSRGPTRVRDLASLSGFAECKMHRMFPSRRGRQPRDKQQVGKSETPNTCIEALAAEMCATLTRKKRTKKTNSLFKLPLCGTNEAQLHQKIVLHNNHQFSAKSLGVPPEVMWQETYSVNAITEKFKYLDINRENSLVVYREENALVPYFVGDHKQNALVLYRQDGTIVPYEGAFDPIKKRRPRPKVDLDEETNRVWKLLLANINSEGIDGTDEEKMKWWEEERSVFQGRAESFIAHMRLVQGDRQFSPWKGSVLDSVIGVFLTQNVSDHLSSSAFMSLAARFPLKSKSNNKEFNEGTGSVVDEPVMTILDSEDTTKWNWKIFNQPFCDQGSMTAHDSEHNEEKEVVNSNESTESSNGAVSPIYKSKNKLLNCSNKEIIEAGTECSTGDSISCHTSFMKLLQIAESTGLPGIYSHGNGNVSPDHNLKGETQTVDHSNHRQQLDKSDGRNSSSGMSAFFASNYLMHLTPTSGVLEIEYSEMFKEEIRSSDREEISMTEQSVLTAESVGQNTVQNKLTVTVQEAPRPSCENNESCINVQQDGNLDFQTGLFGDTRNFSGGAIDVTESTSVFNNQNNIQQKTTVSSLNEYGSVTKEVKDMRTAAKAKARRVGREIQDDFDWDSLRRQAEANGKRERTANTMDSLDWEAVRCANVNEIADTIKERGMNNMLAERIKDFLNRLVTEHGSIDLEWLRDIAPDKAKEYLLSIRGLGLKSVECVRLLTLHHLAFPVDTNVGRIAVRLGWVPLQPLPESLQLHLLELYPVLESIQKYLWPRLCKLDQRTLYELHYQMITFGKVFCTKSKPNCNACPMRGECRHFASAFASARLALPRPEEKGIVNATETRAAKQNSSPIVDEPPLPLLQATQQSQGNQQPEANYQLEAKYGVNYCQPIIEEPPSPEPERTQMLENDIEDAFTEDPDEIPTIKLNMEAFTQNLQNYMQENMELQEGDMSKALVALTTQAASIPTPKLKNVSRLRTEHQVYELPDSHPLLKGLDKREADDPCSYLLAIWTPGETANSIQPPERKCSSQEYGILCNEQTCFSCNSTREASSQIVRGTLLIPCRTAMRGSFPLNGTYFQVNEVFADHDSSLNPIDVPRAWIWNLPRRTVYFGTSIPSIFKGLTTHAIQHCFWRGYVCVRGFDQKTRAPRPLMARLHFPASKLTKTKGKTGADDS